MNIVNKEISKWERPWNVEKFDDLYNRDERFFSILIKGVLSWLNKNVVMYNKPIKHFIFNTGSSYMYVESNGYQFSWSEATGEDWMYMEMPRCVVEIGSFTFETDDMSNPYARGVYERRDGTDIRGFNAEIRRVPVSISLNLKYVCSNFNETIILIQEILDKLCFQQYFKITYLGQVIECSLEFPVDMQPEINKIDMTSTDVNQKNLSFDLKVSSNYPIINERTEVPNDKVISGFKTVTTIESKQQDAIAPDKETTELT